MSAKDSSLLQTAQAYIGPKNAKSGIRARLIFDSGSQKSYITERTRNQLRLATGNKESLLDSAHVLRVAAEASSETSQKTYFTECGTWNLSESGTKNMSFKDGRYHVDLPFKERHAFLPGNYEQSLARLKCLIKRPRREPPVFQEYNKVIEEQLHRGIIKWMPRKTNNRDKHIICHIML